VAASWVTPCVIRKGVGSTFISAKNGCLGSRPSSKTTGSTSASGVGAYPPSAKEWRPAQGQEAAPALGDELRDHAELVRGEEARLHAAQDEAAVLEELLARLGEPARQLVRVVHVQAQELVLRRALQADHLQVLVVGHGAAEELQLEARLAFEVEDLLAAVHDLDGHVLLVVLAMGLAGLGRDAEAERAGPGLGRGEVHARGRGLAVRGQRDLLRLQHAPRVLHLGAAPSGRQAALGHAHLGVTGRALEDGGRARPPA
jgi:hypothetical protein